MPKIQQYLLYSGTHPVCEERLLGLSTKFLKIAILKTGTLIFQPISNAKNH